MADLTQSSFAATLVPGFGVQRIPHLEAFLPDCRKLVRSRKLQPGIDSVTGWGHKRTADRARQIARENGLTYIALEDGFFRSVGHGETGAPPLSLIADDVGIYYDARGPSRLERLLAGTGWETPALLARAEAALAIVVGSGLAKTNADSPLPDGLLPRTSRRRVLIVDQTLGDSSIEGALATQDTFAAMLAAARREEPGAELVVRRHPLVTAGLKQGCLDASLLQGVTILDLPARASDVLGRVDSVYTVSSLMGFEAVLRGLPVRCFGLPFYANWGLSRDEVTSARRGRQRTLIELFAAACLLYTRYVDPLSGLACGIEVALERLLLFRRRSDQNAGYKAAVGFSRWKRNTIRDFLASGRGDMDFYDSVAAADQAATERGGRIIVWAGKETEADTAALAQATAPVCRMEDGFVRSAGLGSDLVAAASSVLDDQGIYYDATRPSRLELILSETAFDAPLLARARALRDRIVAAGVTKYNVGSRRTLQVPSGKLRLLVVGQVEDDRSLAFGTTDVRTNAALLARARQDFPLAHILYKPHPDVLLRTRAGGMRRKETLRFADQLVIGYDLAACLVSVDALATMTSLSGFEAMLRGVPVITYGMPFYAGWGLTDDHVPHPRRTRRLGIEELIAGTLILYSLYTDPATGLPCEPEHVVEHLARVRRSAPRSRIRRYAAGLVARSQRHRARRF